MTTRPDGSPFSSTTPTDSFVFVKIATGIGAGMIIGRRLHTGVAGLAGEIGHIPVRRGADRQCACGNRGCLAEMAAVPGVLRQLSTGSRTVRDLGELQALVRSGDVDAVAALRAAGRYIGEAPTPAAPPKPSTASPSSTAASPAASATSTTTDYACS